MGVAPGTGEQQRMDEQAAHDRGAEGAWPRSSDRDHAWQGHVSESPPRVISIRNDRTSSKAKSSVHSRVKNKLEKGDGMSFAEFSYPVLQSWDWWYMYQTKNIQLQIGGSDQYGNIIAGIDAIKYIAKNHYDPLVRQEKEVKMRVPMGFTTPLLTSSSGEKFGKSAGNAIWLDPDMTSVFNQYQVILSNLDRYGNAPNTCSSTSYV